MKYVCPSERVMPLRKSLSAPSSVNAINSKVSPSLRFSHQNQPYARGRRSNAAGQAYVLAQVAGATWRDPHCVVVLAVADAWPQPSPAAPTGPFELVRIAGEKTSLSTDPTVATRRHSSESSSSQVAFLRPTSRHCRWHFERLPTRRHYRVAQRFPSAPRCGICPRPVDVSASGAACATPDRGGSSAPRPTCGAPPRRCANISGAA